MKNAKTVKTVKTDEPKVESAESAESAESPEKYDPLGSVFAAFPSIPEEVDDSPLNVPTDDESPAPEVNGQDSNFKKKAIDYLQGAYDVSSGPFVMAFVYCKKDGVIRKITGTKSFVFDNCAALGPCIANVLTFNKKLKTDGKKPKGFFHIFGLDDHYSATLHRVIHDKKAEGINEDNSGVEECYASKNAPKNHSYWELVIVDVDGDIISSKNLRRFPERWLKELDEFV